MEFLSAARGLKLRTKILLAIASLLAIVLSATSAWHTTEAHRERVAGLDVRARLAADALAAALAGPIWDYDQDRAEVVLRGMFEDPDFLRASVRDDTGRLFAEAAAPGHSSASGTERAIVVRVEVPYAANTGRSGAIGEVSLALSLARTDEALRADIAWSAVETCLVLLLVCLGFVFAIRKFTRPLEEIRDVIDRAALGDYESALDPSFSARTDEIGSVARSLMADQEQRRDEARLLDLSSAIVAQLHLDHLLARIVEGACELLRAERATLYLYDRATDSLRAHEADGSDAGIRLPASAGFAGAALRSGEPVNVDDARTDPRFEPSVEPAGSTTRSVLALPIVSNDGERLGVIQLVNRSGGPFTERDTRRLMALGAQAGIAIENATHFEETLELNRALSTERDELRRLNEAGGRFVPFEFLEILGRRSLLEVERGDSVEREMSILFSDIRSFTTLVEGKSPEENFRFINDYLAHMERPIHEHDGFVDSYIGDAVMALFPSADEAVQAGIGHLQALHRYNEERSAAGQMPIRSGIGINTGSLMLGTFGGMQRMKCGVIGDCVNLAARIEGMTKHYGAWFLIGEATHARLKDPSRYTLRVIDRVTVKGKTLPATVYEVLDGIPPDERAQKLSTFELFEDGIALFQRGEVKGALERFEGCRAAAPSDMAAALYIARCRELIERGVPAGWDGVFRLATK